jgi:signal transduction histidine kinase
VAINRNNNLNQFMRNFADLVKLPPPSRTKVDLHQLLRNVCELMDVQVKEKAVTFVLKDDQEPFFINVDVQQFEQAIINIVKNALEAIGSMGTITFETDKPRSLLRIIDTGKGITEPEARHLFSPFFSTKKDGQGIGLVLVRDIMINHGFAFSLKTINPQQTVFCIQL